MFLYWKVLITIMSICNFCKKHISLSEYLCFKTQNAKCDEILSVKGRVHKRCQYKYEKHGLCAFPYTLDDSIEWSYFNASKHIKHNDIVIDVGCSCAENISKIKSYMRMHNEMIYLIGIDFVDVVEHCRHYMKEKHVQLVRRHHANLDEFIKNDFNKVHIENKANIVMCFGFGSLLGESTEERQRSYKHISSFLKPDGSIIFDVYYESGNLINRCIKLMDKNELDLHINECVGYNKCRENCLRFLEGTGCNHGKDLAYRDMMIGMRDSHEKYL